MIGIVFSLIALFMFTLISLTSFVITSISAQVTTSPEEVIPAGPVQFSTKIDLGMIIAASAFGSTLIYNIIQMKNAEKNISKICKIGMTNSIDK